MKPARWARIWKIFEEALERREAEREVYIRSACAGDADLVREVESLLSAHADRTTFIGQVVGEAAHDLMADAREQKGGGNPPPGSGEGVHRNTAWGASPAAGRRLGPYAIVRELGRGGMGAVYLAVRADDQYRQQVAIKVVRGGWHSPDLLQRFRSERQILADLNHPHVARLLDGGTTAEGFPYVVMEYIEGEAIDVYCDRRQLSTGKRLELFRLVCSAVQYAHSRLVVHRDIKPANILVTPEGVPKLLDFGIAKLLDPTAAPHAVAETATAARLLTPEYASPEQVRGKTITTASDVYSLGVLLYQLLTGHLPYAVGRQRPGDLERAICDTEPAPPSTAVTRPPVGGSPGKSAAEPEVDAAVSSPADISAARDTTPERLRRQLAGDLDNIALMALRKEPERRYASAEHLSADIGRYLEGRPVQARPDTWSYRGLKLLQRHPLGAAATTVAALALVAFAATMAVQSTRIARERDRALSAEARATVEAERARFEADTATQVTEFLVGLFEVSDPVQSLGEEITAREILDRGAERISGELADQPAVQARLMNTMAEVYRNLGLYEESFDLARHGLERRRSLYGDTHEEVAASLQTLGSLEHLRGNLDEAERLLQAALDQRRASGESSRELVTTLNSLGFLCHTQGRLQAGRRAHKEALDLARQVYGPRSKEVATCMNNLAQILQELGEWDEAERLFRDTLQMRLEILGDEHPQIAVSYSSLGQLLARLGRLEESESYLRRNLELCRRFYEPGHPTIGLALNNLSSVLKDKGEAAAAETLQREACDIFRDLHGEEHPRIALCYNNLANLRHDQGDYEEAEILHRKSLALHRELFGDEHPRLADALNNLGQLLWDKGDHARAEPLFREALALDRKLLGERHPYVAMDLHAVAMVLHGQERRDEAEQLYREAIEMNTDLVGTDHEATATYQSSLGLLLVEGGRAGEAESLLRASVNTQERVRPAGHWQTHQARCILARCLAALGRFDEAEPMMLDSYRALVDLKGEHTGAVRRARAHLTAMYEAMGAPEKAATVASR